MQTEATAKTSSCAHTDGTAAGIATATPRVWKTDLDTPLKWRKPARISVEIAPDLFAESTAESTIDSVFSVMALCPQHVFQLSTSHTERMRDYSAQRAENWMRHLPQAGHEICRKASQRAARHTEMTLGWPLPNVWLGASIKHQSDALERVPVLLKTPAAVRWVRAVPLLGHIDLTQIVDGKLGLFNALHDESEYGVWGVPAIDWVEAGGACGPEATPTHPDWLRGLRDQCAANLVPFHFEHWGEWIDMDEFRRAGNELDFDAFDDAHLDFQTESVRVGKRRAGRMLDGRTHDGAPRPRVCT